MASKPRILLYSHDTYGLGHLRRSLAIAGQVAKDIHGAHQLLITGSMVAGAFGLPPRLDMIKLPALSKRSTGEYKARTLPLSLAQTLAWREQMILDAAKTFQPDLLLVDKVPAGVHGELLPTLRFLKTWSPETRLVLGMRDIEDGAETTLKQWRAAGVPQLLEEVYDHILLYGQRDVFDPVSTYQLSSQVSDKIFECGYLGRPLTGTRSREAIRRELGCEDLPLVVVTVGGGGDGYEIIKNYLEMLNAWEGEVPFYSLIVTGPLMAQGKRALLRPRTNRLTLLEFTPDLFSYMAAADMVVGMAGYNTACEILSLKTRAVLIPRVHPREEQLIRTECLTRRNWAHMLHPDALSATTLRDTITTGLASPRPDITLDLNGLPRASQTISAILERRVLPVARPQTVNKINSVVKNYAVYSAHVDAYTVP
ncbi:MAG TPA: glycosyltransferase [Anaerolineales bacterium]|nr:glycosyltransferase [Anaerolineales bacterium]